MLRGNDSLVAKAECISLRKIRIGFVIADLLEPVSPKRAASGEPGMTRTAPYS